MNPTAEQTAIVDAAVTTDENIIVNARAGAAKTTTIELISRALPTKRILAIAFNKKIATALQDRLPSNCTAMTLNALGNRMFRDFLGKWPSVDAGKMYKILKEEIDHLPPMDRDYIYDNMSELKEAIRAAKASGYLPEGVHPHAKPLITRDDFYDELETSLDDFLISIVEKVLRISFIEAMKGRIDFDDQVYMPVIMPCSFSPYDVTIVDEAQDLSTTNHILLKKVVRKKRLIAVGDPCQAIYGFRGASQSSMADLQSTFGMREFFLTICFRSSQNIVRNARWRAPDMVWRDGASEGLVQRMSSWTPSDILDGDAIICRNNAPLFRMALSLLRSGRNPELMSGDIVSTLVGVMKKLGKPSIDSATAKAALAEWKEAQLKKHKDSARVHDQAACILLFLEESETLGAALSHLEEVCNRPGRIKLMTGHKSKGLEFDRVFFLDDWLCDRKRGQDANIEYVIETRAREALFYVQSNDWHEAA